MEGTERLVGGARPLQWEIAADNFDDIIGRGDLLDEFVWDECHGMVRQ